MKNSFHEFFREFLTDQFSYDLDKCLDWISEKYPHTNFYIQKYGNPYPYEERFLEKMEREEEYTFGEQKVKQGKNFCFI